MLEIHVAYHKAAPFIDLGYLRPIHIGAAEKLDIPGCVRDDDGDNISAKNSLYCELTALYWMWRHGGADIVGLCHYRRYFCPAASNEPNALQCSLETVQSILQQDYSGSIFQQDMENSDIVVPNPYPLRESMERQYLAYHHSSAFSWFAMHNALFNLYRNEFFDAREYLAMERKFLSLNIFISRQEVMSRYCEWLFPLMSEVESLIGHLPEDKTLRICGHLSERLFTWWVHSRKLKVLHRPVLMIV